jgi:hypothetical protein
MMADAFCSGFKQMQQTASADTRAFHSYRPTPEVLAKYLFSAGYPVTVPEAAEIINNYYRNGTLLV